MTRRKVKTILYSFMLMSSLSGPAMAQDGQSYMPNPKLTPGDTLAVTRDDLCKSGYTSPAQKIPVELKHQVLDTYGIGTSAVGYNVDHLIPVRLGGSNSIKNLWPQPLSGEWSYHLKNKLEHKLYKMVCRGDLELNQARQEIATDWVIAYKKYMGEPERAPSTSALNAEKR